MHRVGVPKLRAEDLGWKKISRQLKVGVDTVRRIAEEARESGLENPKPRNFRTPARKTGLDMAGGSAVAPAFRYWICKIEINGANCFAFAEFSVGGKAEGFKGVGL